jgi:uncharacterized repeat protein (TIGR01451 family)
MRRDVTWLPAAFVIAMCLWAAPAAGADSFTVNDPTDAPLANAAGTACASTTPTGSCTLRAAIQAADNLGGPSSIALAANTTYKLTIAPVAGPNGTDDPAHGDLDVEPPTPAATAPVITMTGEGAGSTVIDGGGVSRVFAVHLATSATTPSLSLADLAITGGSALSTPANSAYFAGDGGAIFNAGALTITDSELYLNSADNRGGAVFSGGPSLAVSGSTFTANTAPTLGGAVVLSNGGLATFTNDTLDANNGGGEGGGLVYLQMLAAGSQLVNVTVTRNHAGHEAGIYSPQFAGKIENTIVAGNTTPNGVPANCQIGTATAGAADLGGNLDSGGTCFSPDVKGDRTGVDPKLEMLADNGGPSETDALLPGSPAMDLGLPTFCPATDQRGAPRLSAHCDSGAYQAQTADVALTGSGPATSADAAAVTETFTVTNAGPYAATAVTFTDPLPAGANYGSAAASQGSCTSGPPVTCSLGTLAAGGPAVTITLVMTLSKGNVANQAAVTTSATDPNLQNNSASVTTSVVATSGPTNIKRPAITQAGQDVPTGTTLTGSIGTWGPSSGIFAPTEPTYTYQWLRCDYFGDLDTPDDCSPIAGATKSTFVVPDFGPNIGNIIDLRVTATDMNGSTTALAGEGVYTHPTMVRYIITSPSGVGTAVLVPYECVEGFGIKAVCQAVVELSIAFGGGTRAASAAKTKPKARTIVVGRESFKVKQGHKKILKINLNATGRRLLAKRHTLKVAVTITQKHAKTLHKTVVFKAPHAAHKH